MSSLTTALCSELDNKFESHTATLEAIQDALSVISKPASLSHFLMGIVDDDQWLEVAASQSYVHYNNFDKIVLASSSEPEYKLRLHIWWPDPGSPMFETVHNHGWDFGSVMLLGRYRQQIYQQSDAGIEMYKYEYLSAGEQGSYSLGLAGSGKLSCVFDTTITAGSSYVMRKDVLHRIVSDRQSLTCTLVLHGPKDRVSPTSVFSLTPVANTERLDAVPMSRSNLREKLRRLSTALAQ